MHLKPLTTIITVAALFAPAPIPAQEHKEKKYSRMKLRLNVEVDSGRPTSPLKVHATITNDGTEPVSYLGTGKTPRYKAFITEIESGDYVDFTQLGWRTFGPEIIGAPAYGGPQEIAPGETIEFDFEFLQYFKIEPGKYRLYLTISELLQPGPVVTEAKIQESGDFSIWLTPFQKR